MMTATDSVSSRDGGIRQQRRQTVSAYPAPTPLDLVGVKVWPSDHPHGHRFPDYYYPFFLAATQ